MKKNIFISSGLISTILFSSPIACHAEWIQDSTGWWYSNQTSWSIGWQMINEKWYYFDNNGYMQIGWIQTDGKWYYMYEDGSMAKDTCINGYKLGSNGAWIDNTNTSIDTSIEVPISGDGKLSDISNIDFKNINKIIFFDGTTFNQPLTITDNQKINKFISILNNVEVKNTENDSSTGWMYKACLYTTNNERLEITFNNPLIINGKYYKTTKGNLSSKEIIKFLKSVDPSYITNI
ncbi:cell wall-binding protein [Clostridium butyricum]